LNWSRVLRGRWRMARNTLLGGGRRARAAGHARRPLLGGALAVVLAALVCAGLTGLFGQLAVAGADAREASAAMAFVLTAALLGMLVFDLNEVVSTLIVDSDLELLRRAPIPAGTLFLLKLTDALPRTSLLLLVLAVPATVAYHLSYPLPVWAWLVFPLQLLALWAIPLGIGAAAAVRLLRHVPPRHAREALGLLSTITLFVIWLANSFLLPRLADTSHDPLARLRGALDGSAAAYRFSPGRWAAEALAAAAAGSKRDAAMATMVLLGGAALALVVAAWVASRHLEAAQSAIAGGGAGRGAGARPGAARRGARAAAAARDGAIGNTGDASASLHAPRAFLIAVLARDARLFARDWAVLGDVLATAILWTLLPLLGAPLYHASSHELARAMLLGLTVGLGYEVGARALPLERQGIAWIRLGPVAPARWVGARFTGAALLSVPLMALAAGSMAVTLGLNAREVAETLCVALPALGLALSVGLWTGAVFGRSGWSNPRAMLTVTGRAAATLLLLLQAAAWLALSAAAETRRESLPPGIALWGPALVAALLAIVPLRAAAARLAEREWNG